MYQLGKHSRTLLPVAALALLTLPTAQAQDAGTMIEEIVVTATKRTVGLQDVPLAITALSGDQLERIGAVGFADFYRSAPGLTFNQTDPGSGTFSMRGVSTSITGGNVQPTVALYIDELPTLETFGASGAPDLQLFDIERVEVLRGPQGTLFGSGSMGGAVRVITRKPQLNDLGGALSVQGSSTHDGGTGQVYNGMINLPLVTDRLALRAVGYYRETGGYVDNVGLDEDDSNRLSSRGGRASLLYQATDELKFTGTVTHQRMNSRDRAALNPEVNGKLARSTVLPEFTNSEFTIYNLTAEYDFGSVTLFSSSSYANTESEYQIDLASIFFGIRGARSNTTNESSTFAQELRLSSNTDGRLSWVSGAFYVDRDRDMNVLLQFPGAGAIFGAPSDVIYDSLIQPPATEKALFGEVSYKLSDRWEATLGARWFENESTYKERTSGFLNGGTTRSQSDTSQSKATPKAVLNYRPSDDAMIYLLASQGYRVGQSNAPIPPDPATGVPSPAAYDADTLWNYELGAKTSWLDGRLVLNGAFYYIDWSDIQLDLSRSDSFFYIDNIGEAHSLGAEIELTAQLSRGLRFSTAISVVEAEMDEDNAALAKPVRRGDRMPGVPELTASTTLDYGFPLHGAWNGYGRIDHQYVGKSYDTFDRSQALEMGDYHLVNLRVGVINDQWEMALFARNLMDSDEVMTAYRGVGAVRYLLEPRTIGVEINARF